MPVNLKRIPVTTTAELRKIFERHGYKADEGNHRHIKFVNDKGQELILIKGNKPMTRAILKEVILKIAQHKEITPEETLKLLFGKK